MTNGLAKEIPLEEEEQKVQENSEKEASSVSRVTSITNLEDNFTEESQTEVEVSSKANEESVEKQDDYDFEIPSTDEKSPDILLDHKNKEIIIPNPPPEKKPPMDNKRATETSYYATQQIGGDQNDFEESRNQLITEGKSVIVDLAMDQAQKLDSESDREIIEKIISDPNISLLRKRLLLKTYARGTLFPSSLRERYIDRYAMPDPTSSNVSREAQEEIVETLFYRKGIQHIRSRNQQVDEIDEGMLAALGAGWNKTWMQFGQTVGLNDLTLEDIKSHIDKTNDIASKSTLNAIMAAGAEYGAPLLMAGGTALVAGPLLGLGAITTIGVAALTTGAVEALSKFSELGAEGVDEAIRLESSVASGALLSAEVAIPIVRSFYLAKNIIANGGIAIAISELSIAVQNALLEPYPELKQPQFDLSNLTVNGLMGMTLGLIFRKRKPIKRLGEDDIDIPADSVAESQKVANPEKAAKDAAKIIKNQDDKAANTMTGKGLYSIVNDWVLPNQHSIPKTGPDSLSPDGATSLKEFFIKAEQEIKPHFERRRFDPNVQNAQERYDDIEVIMDVHRKTGGPKRHKSESSMEVLDDVSRGTDYFTTSKGGVYKTEKTANIAMKKLQKTIDNSSAKDDGVLSLEARDNGFIIKWDWEKEYNPLSVGKLGVEDIRMFWDRVDVTKLARSWLSPYIFPTGRHKKMEGGAFRAIEHDAHIRNTFARVFNDAVRDLKLKKEFNSMINHAEDYGVDHFTISEIRTKFSVGRKEAEELYITWEKLRRLLDFEWNFSNRRDRNKKAADGMRGVYFQNEGKPIGMASEKIDSKDLAGLEKGDSYVWDYEFDRKIKYNKKKFEKEGRKLVRLFEPKRIGERGVGESFRFGVLSDKVKLHHLPAETLPKIKGYMPRVTKENFYIDVIPKSAYIDGKLVEDPDTLKKHLKQTKGAARTQVEGEEMAEKLRLNNPNKIVVVRRDRLHQVEQEVEAMQIRSRMDGEAKRKGEWLDSVDGDKGARIEDRFVSLRKTFNNLATTEAFAQWDIAVQNSFMDRYKRFIKVNKRETGEFPSSKHDLELPKGSDKQDEIIFKEALRNFEYYYMMKQMKTSGDFYWEELFHSIADLIEDVVPNKYARGASDMSRRLGNQGNIPIKMSKQMASALYIHLNIPRQWIIQPQQAREMALINPASVDASVLQSTVMRVLISTMDSSHNLNNSVLKEFVGRTGLSEKALRDDFRAIKNSGMLDSLDRNELVRDMFNGVEANLIENGVEKVFRRGSNIISKPIGLARKVGFDAGEISNRLGMWYQAKAIWQKNNPNKNWQSIEAQEEIALEGIKLAGGMSRAGSLPYQRGMISIAMQFQAISHKLTMNLLQDRATILNGKQRAQVAALRFALYGFGAGVPASALMDYTYNVFTDDPLLSDPKYRKYAENGIGNELANEAIRRVFDEEGGPVTDINFSDGLSPYSPHFLPYVTAAIEIHKLFDGVGGTNPRVPLSGIKTALGETASKIYTLFANDKLIDTSTAFKYAIHEIAKLSSGYKNFTKAVIMANTHRIENSRGQDLGEGFSNAESFAQFWGFRSNKLIDNWDGTLTRIQLASVKKDLAENIHKDLVYLSSIIGTDEYNAKIDVFSNLFSVLKEGGIGLGPQDLDDVKQMVLNMDVAALKSNRESFLSALFKYSNDNINVHNKELREVMERSANPKTQELLDIMKKKEY